jgi:uncharacterized protein YkwD
MTSGTLRFLWIPLLALAALGCTDSDSADDSDADPNVPYWERINPNPGDTGGADPITGDTGDSNPWGGTDPQGGTNPWGSTDPQGGTDPWSDTDPQDDTDDPDTGEPECIPPQTRCDGLSFQTCAIWYDWTPTQTCPYGCDDTDGCIGECSPQDIRCSGNTTQTCNDSWQWVDGESCPYGCQNGSCLPDPDQAALECHSSVRDWPSEWAAFEEEVLVLVNQRRAAGATCGTDYYPPVGPLQMQSHLRCAARVHSLDMGERGYFSHDSPGGPLGNDPWERIANSGYPNTARGENIAAGQNSPASVMDGWMDSPGHCRNIMAENSNQIGIGYANVPNSPQEFRDGRQMFIS